MLLVGRGGWLAAPLEALGIKVLFAFPGLVIASLFVTLPFTIREVAYVLEELGTNEEEAVKILNAAGMTALNDMDEAVQKVVALAREAA